MEPLPGVTASDRAPRVLVADNESMTALLLARLARQLGAHVATVRAPQVEGGEAVASAAVAIEPYDLLVLRDRAVTQTFRAMPVIAAAYAAADARGWPRPAIIVYMILVYDPDQWRLRRIADDTLEIPVTGPAFLESAGRLLRERGFALGQPAAAGDA